MCAPEARFTSGSAGASSQSGRRSTATPASASSPIPCQKAARPLAPLRSRAIARCGRSPRHWRTRLVSTLPGPTSTKTRTPSREHAIDRFAEAHRLAELAGERLLGAPGVGRVWRSGRIGVDRAARRDHSLPGEERLEGLDGAGDDGRVEAGRDRKRRDVQPALPERRLGLGDGRLPAGEHDLLRAVVVGEHHVEAELGDELRDRVMARGNREHRALGALGRLAHQPAALGGDLQRRVEAVGAGGVERHHLAKAVAGEAMRTDAEGAEEGEHRCLGRGERRLGEGHPGQPRLLLGAGLLGEGRRREDRVVKARAVDRDEVGRPVPDPPGVLERGGDAAAHTDILAALAGEEEGEPPGFGRRKVEPAAALRSGRISRRWRSARGPSPPSRRAAADVETRQRRGDKDGWHRISHGFHRRRATGRRRPRARPWRPAPGPARPGWRPRAAPVRSRDAGVSAPACRGRCTPRAPHGSSSRRSRTSDTAARRGWSLPRIHGRSSVLMKNGVSSIFRFGFGRSTLIVGGITPWWSAIAALNRPALPAAALVWPICDLTEPSAHRLAASVVRAEGHAERRRTRRRRRPWCRCRGPRPSRPSPGRSPPPRRRGAMRQRLALGARRVDAGRPSVGRSADAA